MRIAIVLSQYHGFITERLEAGARAVLRESGVADEDIQTFPVPGAYELAQAAQRVAVARALVGRPSLLLADEPTGNLDEATASELQQLIRTMHREHGLTSIIVTHNPVLAALCDRIERLEVGRLVSNRLPEGSATQT